MDTIFSKKVFNFVKSIPKGKVSTYSIIASLCGHPGAQRAVGNCLHKNTDPINIPCYRVVSSKGKLSKAYAFGGIEKQRELLEKDGIAVKNYYVDSIYFYFGEK